MQKNIYLFSVALLMIGLLSCGGGITPKPRGYYRIDFPKKEYNLFDSTDYPYHFQYPTYGVVRKDKSRIAEDYWVNIDFDKYKAQIHISYKEVQSRLDSLMEDSRTLAYKHAFKAEAINERFYSNPDKRVYGILYNMKGNTASSWQFYATDSVKHFLRVALYFKVHPNKDSLAPAVDFFGKDLVHLMETLEWND
jgi:gliding motility-associated lipoprotein GldD